MNEQGSEERGVNCANESESTYDAILPAGGRITGAFAQETGTEIKALIRLGGQTLLSRAVQALRDMGRVRRIVVVGSAEVWAEARSCDVDSIEEGASGPDNILRGLDWLQAQPGGVTQRILTVTTDLPFLTPAAIRTFLDLCPPDVDVAMPVVTQAAFEARYPGLTSEFTKLREGAFAPGGVMRVDAKTLMRSHPTLERLFEARKSPLRMAKVIGPGILWRFMVGQLSVDHLVQRARTLLDCSGAAVLGSPPELAFDIDQHEEYAYARQAFETAGTQASQPREALK